ncbi:penicillin-binding protein [Kribbella sandramycini]|uniref:Membrane peptidoglycan carboxypeptidase n=1 Tax=Kribbella sandramycini TaxID=60450 RepID=A0A7Y4NZN7_9ACTN|nr:membrane peptidoglycan carboxypeptidase [Kribbella sandramycini]NOL40174.1 penicillin-binding protein [Kribbella sandramycini]
MLLFLLISAVSGALVAGLALPLAGLADVTTTTAHNTVKYLPQDLTIPPLAQSTTIVASDGKVIANLAQENRKQVTLKQINPMMLKAIVAIEDDRFYQHGAIDLKGTLRALVLNQSRGSVAQGGSSITQQYVKLSLVAKARSVEERAAATADTYERKFTELRYAIAVEEKISKDEILNRYLNLAFFGDRAYGVEAAALHYFGVHASKLTLPQAATLAGLVKSPNAFNPVAHPVAGKERRNIVLGRMRELGIITPKQARDAMRTPVIDLKKVKAFRTGCANSPYPFYCDYVVARLKQNPVFGKTEEERADYIETAGLTVRTSLDRKIQAAAQASIDKHSKPTDEAVAAITIVEPGTGLVKAMAQSKPYGFGKHQTAYNYNVEQSYKGGYGGFQNGSTMKTFTIAAAIQKGVPLNYRINSPQTLDLSGREFKTCHGTASDNNYKPKNSTRTVADPSMIQAAQASTNTYFLQLSEQVGLCPIANLLGKMGMRDAQTEEPLEQVPSMTLGSAGLITPLMLSSAYATFPARGTFCNPQIVTAVASSRGKTIQTPGLSCKPVITPQVADGVNYVLNKVMDPPGTGSSLKFGSSDLAGKTGTIDGSKAVWFAGYSTKLSGVSVVADATPKYTDLQGQTLNGRTIGEASGSKIAGPFWETAMRAALKNYARTKFVQPDQKTIRGNVKNLPNVKGMTPEQATVTLKAAGFKVAVATTQVDSDAVAGTVAWTTPRAEEGALAGATILLWLSNGSKAPPPTTPPPPGTTPPPPGTSLPPIPPPTKPTGGPACPPWDPQFPNCRPPRR